MKKFDAEAALRLIQDERITHSQWVPTMFVRLLALAPEVRGEFDLSSHRIAIHAAAPCPKTVKHAMIEWWETSSMNTTPERNRTGQRRFHRRMARAPR